MLDILADRTRLMQILMNLGSNAIKYNRPGGRVTIAAAALDDATVRVTVTDTGIGIPLDRQDPGAPARQCLADQAVSRADVHHQVPVSRTGAIHERIDRAAVDEEVLAEHTAPDGSVRHAPSVAAVGERPGRAP